MSRSGEERTAGVGGGRAEQDKVGVGGAAASPSLRSHPSSSAAAGMEPWGARRPCDWQPADGGGALEFIIQACLSEGASLSDTALSESWEWLAEPIC